MELNEEVKNEKEPKDGIALVKKYEDLLKGANKKIINIIGKQGEILKKFNKDGDFFFLSWSKQIKYIFYHKVTKIFM